MSKGKKVLVAKMRKSQTLSIYKKVTQVNQMTAPQATASTGVR